MNRSPRWMHLAATIFENAVNLDPAFDQDSNVKVAHMMKNIMRSLMAGHTLSDKQAEAFIKNIRLRVPYQDNFSFFGPVKLSKKQRCDAKANPKYEYLLAEFEKQNKQTNEIRRLVEGMVAEYDMDEQATLQFMAHIRRYEPGQSVTGVTK